MPQKTASTGSMSIIDVLSGKKIPGRNFYVITGDSQYPLLQAEEALTRKFLPDDPSRSNRIRFDCASRIDSGGAKKRTLGDRITESCEQFPFGSEYMLVIVENAQKLKSADMDKLKEYLSDPAPAGILVFLELEEDSGDSNANRPSRSLKKEIGVRGLLITSRLNFRELREWAKARFADMGKEIDPSAQARLMELVGEDMGALSQEIEKISLYMGDKARIGLRDVEKLTRHRPQSKIFHLTEKVGSRDISSALKLLDELLKEKAQPLGVISALNSHFNLLYHVMIQDRQGNNSDQIARILKKHPFYIKKCVSQARNFSEKDMETALDLIARADGGLKSGMNERLVMEMTLIQICR